MGLSRSFGQKRPNHRPTSGGGAAVPVTFSFATPGDHSNVDLANSAITGPATSTPAVTLRIAGRAAEGISDTPVWWSPFVQMQGCTGKTPTFTLPNTQYRYTTFAGTQKLLWSTDARTWQAFTNDNGSGTTRVCSHGTPFASNDVYVSWLPSIKVADRAYYYGQIAASAPSRFRTAPNSATGVAATVPAGRIGAAGQAIPVLPVLGAQVEDFTSTYTKRTMVLIMGCHPSEDHGERAALAFLRAAVADNWFMARWRVLTYWINPAGQHGGCHRTTFEGSEAGGDTALLIKDSNRQWTNEPSTYSDVRAVKTKVLADMAALGIAKVDLFIDYHGAPDTTGVFAFTTAATPTAAEAAFGNAWSAVNSGFALRDGSYTITASYNWAKGTIAFLSFNPEVGGAWGATSESSYDPFGQQLLAATNSATAASLFPAAQTQGVFDLRMNGAAGVLDLRSPPVASTARNAWAA